MGETTTIKINKRTHKKLFKMAKYGETMDGLINRLIRGYGR